MSYCITLAIDEEGNLTTRDCLPELLSKPSFILAAHLAGRFALDLLSVVSAVPLLYATTDSLFNFTGAQAWFESEQESPSTAPANIAQLIARLGSGCTLELLLTGATLDASQAIRIGLVNDLCSRAEFDEKIAKLAKLSLSAIELAVELSRRAPRLGQAQAEALERYAFALRFAHRHQREGMQAFVEKRPPRF